MGHERSAYLNQCFVIPKVIVDERLADEGFRLNRIEFARSSHLGSCLSDSTIGRSVAGEMPMKPPIVRA